MFKKFEVLFFVQLHCDLLLILMKPTFSAPFKKQKIVYEH